MMAQGFYDSATWYEATAQRPLPSGPLASRIEADVCVIGAGLAGLTCSLELARTGKKVVLLEALRVGAGASGRNGGFVSNGFALGIADVARHVGPTAARELYKLSAQGTEYVRMEIASGDATIKMGDGWIVAVRHDDGGGLKAHAEMMNSLYGEDAQYLPHSVIQARLVSDRYFAGCYFPKAFHIHPLRYCLLLASKAVMAGAQIYENSAVLGIEKSGGGFLVRTASGAVQAGHVVHCVSATGRNLPGPTGGAVLPIATYVAVTEPLAQQAILTTSAISDTRRAGDYYRLIDEGRILWGGRITTRVSEPAHLAEKMKGDMLATFPALGNPRIDYAWSGLMSYALHKMPLIGRGADGQWFATAFGGHGLNTTAMAGRLISSAIATGDETYLQFAPFAPRWAFGPLGRLGVQATYWWMQINDKIDESRRTSKK